MQKERGISTLIGIIVILAFVLVVFGGALSFEKFVEQKYQISNQDAEKLAGSQNLGSETAGWKTYVDNVFGYEIKYPESWSIRSYDEGVAFAQSTNTGIENEIMNVGYYARGTMYCSMPFSEYVKNAGEWEIENYGSYNKLEEKTSINGVKYYKIIWNVTDHNGNKKVSLPITYFGINDKKYCGSIEAFLNKAEYADIYDKVISKFKFTK